MTAKMRKVSILAISAVAAAAAWMFSTSGGVSADITVYKSPSCGCCSKWAEHLRAEGYAVEVVGVENLGDIKDRFAIPGSVESCHTATVGGYVVEGHVPAEDVRWLLDTRPDVRGLAVPGMPAGSLGMEGRYVDPYDVMLLKSDGSISVHAKH